MVPRGGVMSTFATPAFSSVTVLVSAMAIDRAKSIANTRRIVLKGPDFTGGNPLATEISWLLARSNATASLHTLTRILIVTTMDRCTLIWIDKSADVRLFLAIPARSFFGWGSIRQRNQDINCVSDHR